MKSTYKILSMLKKIMVVFHFIQLVIFILPAYLANSTPILLGGGTPIDFNKKFIDGGRIFGDGKTIRGFVAGISFAFLIGALQANILPLTNFGYFVNPADYIYCGLLLGFGTMFGDLLGSFIKRRFGFKRGSPMFFFDELSFLLVSLLFAWLVFSEARIMIDPMGLVFLIVLTYAVHKTANIAANKMGWKKVPW